MSFELCFLGTGTSAGVPIIACDCAVCRSADPRDQRTRPSVLVSYPDQAATGGPSGGPGLRRLLVDAGPDLRVQAIRHRLGRLDGVLFTHAHADHIFGVDDLRRFNAVMGGPIDIYAERAALDRLHQMFGYIFEPHKNVNQTFVANLIPHEIRPEVPLDLFGVKWTPLRLLHGRLPILGFRVDHTPPGIAVESHRSQVTSRGIGNGDQGSGISREDRPETRDLRRETQSPNRPITRSPNPASMAYCTDVSAIPPETFPLLENLDVLVIDGLRYRHHPTHLTIDQAVELIDRIKPRAAYLTHMAHDVLHADLAARLPESVFLAYDGLKVEV